MCWLTGGCSPNDQSIKSQAVCRIQRIASTSTNGTTAETVYDYDPAGNLLSNVFTQHYTNQSDLTTVTKYYTYDAASFLTHAVVTNLAKKTSPGGSSIWQVTSTTDYTYTYNRLTAYTQRDERVEQVGANSPQSRTTTTTGTYTYDAGGQLTQTTGNGLTTTYQNGKVVGYLSTSPFTVENGLVTKAWFPGTNSAGGPANLTQNLQYDEQRRIIRYQEAVNDSLTTYYTQEWQTGKLAEQSLPLFKGHPVVQLPFGELGVVTNYKRFYANQQPGGKPYLFSETATTNQLNAQEFVVSSTARRMARSPMSRQPFIPTPAVTTHPLDRPFA